jgi:hypothetical protein
MKKLLFLLIPIVVLALVFSRNDTEKAHQAIFAKEPAAIPASASQDEKLRSLGYTGDADKPQSIVVRKIIRSGEVTLQVKHYEPFFQALQKRIDLMGGFVANIQSQRSGESVSTAALTLRIPPAQLQMLVSWLREQGMIANEHIQAEDISEQYYDLKARLENAKRFESRLLEMIKTQTGNLQDLILVEGKLNEVREQIEQMEGKVRYFDALTDLATLTVQVQVESVYIPPVPPTFAHRVAAAWRNSLSGLFETSQAFALIVVAVTPWILPLMIVAVVARFLVRFVWRMLRRNRGLQSAVQNVG